MTPPLKGIHVEDGWLSSKIVWPRDTMRPVHTAGRATLFWQKFNLWDNEIATKLPKLASFDDLIQGLASLCSVSSPNELMPIFGEVVADRLPWEALARYFVEQETVFHPVRALDGVRRPYAAANTPARVAMLIGHPGPSGAFDLQAEARWLQDTFARTNIRLTNATLVDWLDLTISGEERRHSFFKAANPDTVLYFGHGRAGKDPGIRIGPNRHDWLSIKDLVASAATAVKFPSNWIFLACSLGQAPESDHGPAGPDAFRLLSAAGARAMLAMRALIRPDLAKIVGESLIESLCGGLPLEFAANTARKAAKRSRLNNNIELMDWAAPAVWSQAIVPGTTPIGEALPQLAALMLTRLAVDDPGIGLSAPAEHDTSTAVRWMREGRLRLDTCGQSPTFVKARIGNIAGAMSRLSDRPVLYIHLEDGTNFQNRLYNWAVLALRRLDEATRNSALGLAVSRLAERDLEGLQALIDCEGLVLVFNSPPEAKDVLVWETLESGGAANTLVVGYSSRALQMRPGWVIDRLDDEDDMANIKALAQDRPISAALLCASEVPVSPTVIELISGEQPLGSTDIANLVRTPGGVVLSTAAKAVLLKDLDPKLLTQAHLKLFDARQTKPPLIESDDMFGSIRHLVQAQSPHLGEFVNHWVEARRPQWNSAFWLRLAKVLEPVPDYWSSLAATVLLNIASELISTQNLRQAELWLDTIETDNAEDEALISSQRSEIEKARGTTSAERKMWEHARRSAEIARAAADKDPQNARLRASLRRYDANLARLALYFNHDAAEARDIYLRVEEECKKEDPVDTRLLVATLRNLAECLFEFDPFRGAPANRVEARGHLERAERLARDELGMMRCEVLYSMAKLDELEGDWAAAEEHLAATVSQARSAGHVVCERIAAMRLFRLSVTSARETFNFVTFSGKVRRLEYSSSHAWAFRYAAQSRVWAAYHLEALNDERRMEDLLERNVGFAAWNQDRRAGSDRQNLALSFAGLASAEAKSTGRPAAETNAWQRFLALSWAATWCDETGNRDPADYWVKGR